MVQSLVDKDLSRLETLRYLRQINLAEIGLEGQNKLKKARVLCVGIGGLGSASSGYLAGAGVGTLGLMDFDHVDLMNLHRQLLFDAKTVGEKKAAAAGERLRALNPEIKIVTHEEPLDCNNAASIICGYDVIVDATDNFLARYLINDTAAALGKPDVWAAAVGLEGRLSVFDARRGPCYRCLYPQPPAAGVIANCREAGIAGPVAGVMGVLQALEAIKLIAGFGDPLIGKLLHFNGFDAGFREFAISKSSTCRVCAPQFSESQIG